MKTPTNKHQGLQLPSLQENSTSQTEPVFLMEAQNGMLVRVPQSKLESWQAAQEAGVPDEPLSQAEQRLIDSLVQRAFGSKK